LKLNPGLLLISREFIKRKLVLDYFDDATNIAGINPIIEIIPFLKYLNILDSNNYIHEFHQEDSDEKILQKILYLYILKRDQDLDSDFRWLTRAYKGINFIRERVDDNMNACFRQANLYNDDSELMEEWWDNIYAYSRKKTQEFHQETGREGEKLSFLYELQRVGIKPRKEYIQNTSAGYDLLSIHSHNSIEKLMIETKSSTSSINQAEAFITRNELDMAIEHSNYIFHFWLLREKKLAILDRELLITTAPKNINEGEWEKFKVPFITFVDHFKEVSFN
tara:strand:- start:628 stop:1464 length:837 start_codon:yes stop_codon:yes gene_type:complete